MTGKTRNVVQPEGFRYQAEVLPLGEEQELVEQIRTLPLKEFELLFKLASYPGRTFAREQLIEDIWGYDFTGTDRTLDVHISWLRRAVENDIRNPRYIKTVRGVGYRLDVDEE